MVSKKSILAMILAFFECVLFGGTIYGWYSLVFVLKKDGIFSQLCGDTNSSLYLFDENEYLPNGTWQEDRIAGCEEQDNMLVSVYTTASATFGIVSFPLGWTFDKLGLRVIRLGARYEKRKAYILIPIQHYSSRITKYTTKNVNQQTLVMT